MSLLRKVENSMIFICLTPNPACSADRPKGEHLKITELGSHKERGIYGVNTFRSKVSYLILCFVTMI
jgi:hypothetical protein